MRERERRRREELQRRIDQQVRAKFRDPRAEYVRQKAKEERERNPSAFVQWLQFVGPILPGSILIALWAYLRYC